MMAFAEPFGVESPAYALLRWLQSVLLVLLIGVSTVRWLILPRARSRLEGGAAGTGETASPELPDTSITRRIEGTGRFAAVSLIGLEIARLLAQYVAVFGPDMSWSLASARALLLDVAWGRAWIMTLLGTVALWMAIRSSRQDTRGAVIAFWTGVVLAVYGVASSGHAAASHGWRPVAMQSAHILAAGTWIGTLAVIAACVLPPLVRTGTAIAHGLIAAVIAAFSPVALASGALLVATGAAAALRYLGSPMAVAQSAYGRTLLLKLAFLTVAAGAGAYNWKRVLPTLGSATGTARLRRSALIELLAALFVLAVTAVLVATPLPADAGG